MRFRHRPGAVLNSSSQLVAHSCVSYTCTHQSEMSIHGGTCIACSKFNDILKAIPAMHGMESLNRKSVKRGVCLTIRPRLLGFDATPNNRF